MGGGDFPGPISNEDIIEQETHQIVCDDKNQYLNINLKDNLKEEDHYIILNKEIWDFLSKRYGGWTIQRFVTLTDTNEFIIEVYLAKIYTYFFPMAQENQQIFVLYTSRYSSLNDIMRWMERRKEKPWDKMRFWKGKVPKDLDKFYWDLYCEWKKYRVAKFHGEQLTDFDRIIDDI